MEATKDWTRKKTAHSTACWDCYRCHRACDGTRPCKRCVDLGRGASCRDPTPNERIPRKKKRSNSKDRGKSSFTVSKPKGFFIVDPQFFLSKTPLVVNNQISFKSPSSFPTSLPLDQEFTYENEPTQTNQREEMQFQKPPVFRSVLETEKRFTQQLILDQPPSCSYLTPRHQPTRITMEFDIPPAVEDFMEEIRVATAEIHDHRETTDSVFQSLSVPDDMIHLTESFFTPFGLRDSTQPFFVFKFHVDLRWLERNLQEPNDKDMFCPIDEHFLLTASPSFCDLIQYSEEELLGHNCAKMLPSPVPMPVQDPRPILKYLCPQTSIRVSPIFKINPFWFMRNGLVIHANSTMQLFYASNGTISFVVIGIEKFSISRH